MKVKTNFKQMYLVDNVLYNKLNQYSTKPYFISSNASQPPQTINFQPPPTFHPPTPIKDAVLQDNPPSFESKFEPPLIKQENNSQQFQKVSKSAPFLNDKKNISLPTKVSEEMDNAKPFEIEANKFLDDVTQGNYVDYSTYTQKPIVEQPTQQQPNAALEFNEPKQLAVKIHKQLDHDSSKQLLSHSTPVIRANTSQQTRALQGAVSLTQPMEYQQSLPINMQIPSEAMHVDDDCKECDLADSYRALPPPPSNPALPPPPSNPALPPIPSIPALPPPPSNPALPPPPSNPALATPSTYPALPPPPSNPTLPPPSKYPALRHSSTIPALAPPSTYPVLPSTYPAIPSTHPTLLPPLSYPALQSSFSYPARQPPSSPSLPNRKLALPAPESTLLAPIIKPTLQSTIPALPSPKQSLPSDLPVKYEPYTKQIPTKMTYICTRCNTSYKKESSLINHNKRFHNAFNQSVKGVKRLSKDETTYVEKKKAKIAPEKRILKQIQGSNKKMLSYDPYTQST